LAAFAIASLASTVFSSPLQPIVARGIAGAGAAFIMPATLSLLTATHRDDQRAKAVGIWAGVAGSGAVIGMLGSGTLLHFWSWRSIFWAFAVSAAVLAVTFGFVEARRRHPLLDVRLFRKPDFATGSATITVFFLAMFGFFFLIMQYIQLVMGYSPIQTAFALSPLMVPMLTLSALAHWYLPRMGLRLVVFVGLLLISVGFLCLRVLQLHSPYWDMMWPLLVMSTGIGFCTAPSTFAIMAAVPDEKQGVASAVNDTTREVGAALGIALAGSILAARHTHAIASHLAAFPQPLRAPASHSLAQALQVAKTLGPQGAQLAELSQIAFLRAMESSLLVMGVIIAVAALVIGAWAPGRDGQQLRPVRRIASLRRGDAAGRNQA
jgi:predicted MFS family arabinose efflux permease